MTPVPSSAQSAIEQTMLLTTTIKDNLISVVTKWHELPRTEATLRVM